MNCEATQAVLIEFAHHELADPERVEVTRHLAACPGCAVEFCRVRADLEGLTQAYCEAPRPAVRDALRRRVASEIAPSWRARAVRVLRRPVPIYKAAALAAALPAVVWLSMDRAAPEPPNLPGGRDSKIESTGIRTPAVLDDYDASTMLAFDDSML